MSLWKFLQHSVLRWDDESRVCVRHITPPSDMVPVKCRNNRFVHQTIWLCWFTVIFICNRVFLRWMRNVSGLLLICFGGRGVAQCWSGISLLFKACSESPEGSWLIDVLGPDKHGPWLCFFNQVGVSSGSVQTHGPVHQMLPFGKMQNTKMSCENTNVKPEDWCCLNNKDVAFDCQNLQSSCWFILMMFLDENQRTALFFFFFWTFKARETRGAYHYSQCTSTPVKIQ